MKNILFVCIFACITLFSNGAIYNPYVNSASISTSFMLPAEYNGNATLSFKVGNNGTIAMPLIPDQEMSLVITLSYGIPDNTIPVNALTGTGVSFFDWTYDPAIKTFRGKQNQSIPANWEKDISIAYKVSQNSSSGSPSNGFNINLQPPPYTNGINNTNDDTDSKYVYVIARDYGDAPASYGTISSLIDVYKEGGSAYKKYMYMGTQVDPESTYPASANADGDDTGGSDDEDGVTAFPPLYRGAEVTLPVDLVFRDNSYPARLYVWIDYNKDGDFLDAGEQVHLSSYTTPAAAINQTKNIVLTIPLNASEGTTYARFRIGENISDPTLDISYGEVEDYKITILPPRADLEITKTDSPDPVNGGSTLTYTLTVTNKGPSPAASVKVTDALPANYSFVNYTINVGTPVTTWPVSNEIPLGDMAKNDIKTIVITGTVNINQCTPLSNTATVSSPTEDVIQGNNTSGAISTTVNDITNPIVANCAVTRNITGCATAAITGPNFSTTSATSTETIFENGTNGGSVSDNCGITEVTYIDQVIGSCPVKVRRTWTFKDAKGNSASCNQEINVIDNTPPNITSCGTAKSAYANSTCQAMVPDFTSGITVTDICTATGSLTITQSPAAGTMVGLGANTVTVTVKDACNNSSTCTNTFTVNNLSISGTVFDDGNGTLNSLIDGTGIKTVGSSPLYMNVVSGTNVVGVVAVGNNGIYSIDCSKGIVQNNTFTLVLSTVQGTIGQPVGSVLATNWVVTAEGTTGTGDGNPDGRTTIPVGTSNVSSVNFGVDQLPNSNAATQNYTNPGGTNQVTAPTLTGTDPEDGSLGSSKTVVITTLPINGVLYYNGIAVTQNQTITNYDPSKLKVDPNDGTLTLTFMFAFVDAAGKQDPTPATATLYFTDLIIAGNVFEDSDGMNDSKVDGTGTNASNGVFINIVTSADNKVVVSVLVNPDGSFNFGTVNGILTNTGYNLILSNTLKTVGSSLTVSTLPHPWISTGEVHGTGTGNDGTVNGNLSVNTNSGSVSNANFGIKKIPDVTPTITAQPNVMNGTTNFIIFVKVTELNNVSTEGLITVSIPFDSRISLDTNPFPNVTILGGIPVKNADWTISTDGSNYVFQSAVVIPAGSFSTFGVKVVFTPGSTTGILTITSQIQPLSGGEVRIDNNVDAEKLDYFIY